VLGYRKGARAERELIDILSRAGFSVVRAAGSGVAGACPDLLAFRHGAAYAFECKSWAAGSLAIRKDKYAELQRWADNSGITTMIAWKVPRKGWLLLHLAELSEQTANWTVTLEHAFAIGRGLGELLGAPRPAPV